MILIKRYNLFLITTLILNLKTLISQPISSSFSLIPPFTTNFNPDFTLLGDAQITNKGNFVNLTTPLSGSGQIISNQPFKFTKPFSFSTVFTFTMINPSKSNGDGMVFVIFPKSRVISDVFDQGYFGLFNNSDYKFVAVEFDTRKDDNVGDLNDNHVGIDVKNVVSSVVYDVGSVGLLLNDGKALTCWIDYESSSKRLEIRLAEYGFDRPYTPLISYFIDMSKMWGDDDVLVGISSSNAGSDQVCSLSSWSFKSRDVSRSLHSEPLNPEMKFDKGVHRRKQSCFLTVLGAVIFATGVGTLVAFLALFAWVVLFGRHCNVVPELCMSPVDFKYEKVDVVTVDGELRRLSTS